MNRTGKCTLLGSALGLSLWAIPGFAQEAETADADTGQIEEIVVTAQKRAENLQDVPLAVSAFSGDSLEERGVTNVLELTTVVPSLQIQTGGGGSTIPFLRGIGSTASAVGNESSIAIYVDGVYYTRLPPGFLGLSNIERVEVLKGPQGTLFGRNSSGGVINIVTPDPSYDFSVKGSVGYGRFDTFRGNLYITGGLSETVAIDLSAGRTKQGDGWGENLFTGGRVGFLDDFTIRSKLMFEPSSETKLLLSGFYTYSASGSQGNIVPGFVRGWRQDLSEITPTLPNFHDHDMDIDGRLKAKNWGASLRAEHDFGPVTLTSITAYTKDDERSKGDGDYGPHPEFIYFQQPYVKQWTQEFQLNNSNPDKLTWLVGSFYYNTDTSYPNTFTGDTIDDINLSFLVPVPIQGVAQSAVELLNFQKVKSFSVYGQATYEITDELSFTGGLRYTHDKISGHGHTNLSAGGVVALSIPTPPDSETYDKVTFRTALDYKFADDVLGYVSFNRGYKSAAYNLIPFTAPPQRPETLDAYEIGLKSEFFDRRVRINSAAFYYDVSDPQVQLLRNGSLLQSNAEASRVYGFELDGQFAVTDALTARFGVTFLDSKYSDYSDAPSLPPNPNPPFGAISPAIVIDAAGNRTPLAPKTVFNLGADYAFETSVGEFQLTADFYHNSGYYFEPDNLLHQGSYDLLSAHVSYKPTEHVAIRFWGKNLLGEEYVALALSQEGPPSYPFLAGAPRTYGITAEFNF